MTSAINEAFRDNRPEVLDVVGDHRAAFGGRGLEHDPVESALNQVRIMLAHC